MICEQCNTTYIKKEERLNLKVFGLCDECGLKPEYQGLWVGYVYGISSSGMCFYLLLMALTNLWLDLAYLLSGPVIMGLCLWQFVRRKGRVHFSNQKQFDRLQFPFKVAGFVIGIIVLVLWLYIGLYIDELVS